MARYLLELESFSGGNRFTDRHIIEASDEQMVKYHFHRTLKDWGWTDTQYKHALEGNNGMLSEIIDIKKLDEKEYTVLKDIGIPFWPKI